jgi:hypothetical protein
VAFNELRVHGKWKFPPIQLGPRMGQQIFDDLQKAAATVRRIDERAWIREKRSPLAANRG